MHTTDDRDHGRDHGRDEPAAPITDEVHDTSWSANLETPRHADDRVLTVRDALAAIDHTTPGNHVNLVTHGSLGHPETFLYEAIEAADDRLDPEYVEQCGCGGHVTRVQV